MASEITIDATALTLDGFTVSGHGQFPTRLRQALSMEPGVYVLGTLFGPTFEFRVTGAGTVDFDADLGFLSGAGTTTLTVHGFPLVLDATALTLDRFSLFDTASGLGSSFPTDRVETVTLIPGSYRFGTLFGPTFIFAVTGTGVLEFDAGLIFVTGSGTTTLTVHGFPLVLDATALTLDRFSLFDTASGLGSSFPTDRVETVTLIPGSYRFGTLFGPTFIFAVTGTGVLEFDAGLIFVTGSGTTTLTVHGFPLVLDATALTLDRFSLFDTASGLGSSFPTDRVETVTLIPGSYRFGTLFGPTFIFAVTGTGVLEFDAGLIFVTGSGTTTLTVHGFPLVLDATALTLDRFSLFDTASGLGSSFPTDRVETVTLIPGSYRFGTLFGPTFIFAVTGTGVLEFDAGLIFVTGSGTTTLTVHGFPLVLDATALTLDRFSLFDTASGLGSSFPTDQVETVTLIPGSYRFGTLFGPTFIFAVTGTGVLEFDAGLIFVTGSGTTTLTVHGFPLVLDATALTLDRFSLFDTASGLGSSFPTDQVETVTLIPGSYRFGTLFGPTFIFAVTGTGVLEFDAGLIFVTGSGTTTLTVHGFPLELDARDLTADHVSLFDGASGLNETLPTADLQRLTLIPGLYSINGTTPLPFTVTSTGVFDYDPVAVLNARGRGTRRLRILETAMAHEEVISTIRIGQLTGSVGDGWPEPVDAAGWPLLTNMTPWGVVGVDLGANTDHNGRLFIFFGDVATHQRPQDQPLNSDLVAWTAENTVARHGGHLPRGFNFVLPFDSDAQGQRDWQFCLKCHALFFNGDRAFKGVCPQDGMGHDTFGVGLNFVIPFEPTSVQGQPDWRFCGKCASMFWDGDVTFKGSPAGIEFNGTCPAGGSHEAIGLRFVLPFDPTGVQGQKDWRPCRNCGGLVWDGEPDKGICAGSPGGGIHLRAVLDPDRPGNFDVLRAGDPFGFTGSLETPNGAFSFDGRAYLFAGNSDEMFTGIRRPGRPTLGQFLLSKADPAQPGPYDIEWLMSPKLGWCAGDASRSSFLSHQVRGNRFVLRHGFAPSADREHEWRTCRKCEALFFDGDPAFKGVCQRGGPHEADQHRDRRQNYAIAHGVPENAQTQTHWQRCLKCLLMFWTGVQATAFCPAGGQHQPTGADFGLEFRSIEEDLKNQAGWRFCRKCAGLFFAGADNPAAGTCPRDQAPHEAQGHDFVLTHDVGEGAKSQTHWRFCVKCSGLYFDGYLAKGRCPRDGGGHEPAGFVFSLQHSVPEAVDRQTNWHFCRKCSVLFFLGSPDVSVCPFDGLHHDLAGLEFALRHNPGQDGNAVAYWRFCTRCGGLVRANQTPWFPWIAPWVVDNARHSLLPQRSGPGVVMVGLDWGGQFRLAWMPLAVGARPRFDALQYYHAGTGRWSDTIDEAPGYGLFTHPFPGQYTHVSAAWLDGPERWIVLYATAWDKTRRFTNPAVARVSEDLLEWSDEIRLFDPVREKAYSVYMHQPGQDTIHPKLPPSQPPGEDNPGWAYGIFLVNRYTTWDPGARVLGIYYLLSTGSPYQVQLMHTTIRLP